MFNIIENPANELFLDGPSLIDFDGTPHSRPEDADIWKVISKAPCANDWHKNPGDYRTYNMTATVCVVYESGQVNTYSIGGTIQCVRNHIVDVSAFSDVISAYLMNERAWGCRNVARSMAEVEV